MTSSRPLARGDVVLIAFPFTDRSGDKVRPAVVVARIMGEDLGLAFITSRIDNADPHVEVVLLPGGPEFLQTGLKAPSAVRLNKIATLHRSLALRRIGVIGAETMEIVGGALRYVFEL